MNTIQKFFQANKVLIFGVLAAIAMTVQQYTSAAKVDYKVLGLAALVAAIGFLAKNLRGQLATILASIVPSLGIILTQAQTNVPISWMQVMTSAAIAIAGVFAPPTKSLSYEQTPEIATAKAEAAQADASAEPPKNPPVSK